jgi:hypothetical protein
VVRACASTILADGCELEPVVDALEERSPEFFFEIEDLPIDRRRNNMQLLSRLADRSCPDDFHKIADYLGVH